MKTPAKVENFRDFYDSVARLYPEEELVFKSLRGIVRRQFILAYLEKCRGRLLDLGCNRGYYIAQYTNGAVFGVDISLEVLKVASGRLPDFSFLSGDVQELGFFKENSFDAILCSEVIEHVPDPQKVISGCLSLLKPGGTVLITTPNYKNTKPTWISVGAMKSYDVDGVKNDKYFHTAFKPSELKSMAEQAGFTDIEVGTFEKEVKYATRIPVVFYHVIDFVNRVLLHSQKLENVNEALLNRSSLFIYRFCKTVGLNGLLVKIVREGVRSYLLARR